MTSKNQQDVVKHFKKGVCRLLIATSVAEEGLDIKACNCVFRYNYTTNEIGRVQSKGAFIVDISDSVIHVLLGHLFPKHQITRCVKVCFLVLFLQKGISIVLKCRNFHDAHAGRARMEKSSYHTITSADQQHLEDREKMNLYKEGKY